MKIEKHLLLPERLRRCPAQFSFLDHRLVRGGYLQRASASAWALYLVLVTVGDERGLSYYSEKSLARLLSLTADEIVVARRQLVQADLIAYIEPLYQVLALAPTEAEGGIQ